MRAQHATPFVAAVLLSGTTLVGTYHQPRQPSPPMPYEDVGACPFEGCAYGEWTATGTVAVRRKRALTSPIVFRVRKGEKVTAITGVVVTTKAGRVQFREPVDLSTSTDSVHVDPSETLYLLTYRGEGWTKAWFKGRMYDELDGSMAFLNGVCEITPAECVGTIVEHPQQVWWVQVRTAGGRSGWTSEPDKFDGKDALGGRHAGARVPAWTAGALR